MEKKYCVYVHTNKANGKKYFGITSQKPESRWKNGYRYNSHFSRAIEKYGWEGFNHEVIMDGLTKEQACAAEIALIAKHGTQDPNKGYNIQSGGEGCAEQNNIAVNQYSLDGRYIKTWSSMKEADAAFGVLNKSSGSQIGMVCRGACKTANGYMWAYSTGDSSDIEPYETKRYKKVAQYTTSGKLIKMWNSIKEASDALGIDGGSIVNVCKGKYYRTAGGFVWRYRGAKTHEDIEKVKPYKRGVLQYEKDGKLIREFESVAEASRHVCASANAHIIECCKGLRKTAYGYIWRYYDAV